MADMLLLPIVMLGVLSRDRDYATPIQTYEDAVECIEDLPIVSESYLPDFPGSVFWCANPIGRVAAVDPLAAPDLATAETGEGEVSYAPKTSLRPKPRPENLETNIDYD